MSERFVIAFDLGTSSLKAVLLDAEGRIVARGTSAYPVSYPKPGWAEQEPQHWRTALQTCIRTLTRRFPAESIAAVCGCSHEMCSLPVDEQGNALCNAIIWADGRASKEMEDIEARIGADTYYRLVGMRAAANYPIGKMLWLKRNRPDIYEKTFCFLNPKDYINHYLTGVFATDPECAAYMHCTDLEHGDWNAYLLQSAGVDPQKLPVIMQSGTIIGSVTAQAAKETGLAPGTPVVMGMGDAGAATLGTATRSIAEAYTNLGTSSWVSVITGTSRLDPERRIVKLRYLDTMRDTGAMQSGGHSLNWFKELLYPADLCNEQAGESPYDAINRLAAQSPAGANGVLYLPYLLGERAPYWDPRLSGAFLGLHAETGRKDLCRSVMEGVAMHLNTILGIILQVNAFDSVSCMKLVGGGAKSKVWQQIFSDVYQLPIATVAYPNDVGALGVGAIAGVAVKLYEDLNILSQMQPIIGYTYPNSENAKVYASLMPIFQDAARCIAPLSHRLNA